MKKIMFLFVALLFTLLSVSTVNAQSKVLKSRFQKPQKEQQQLKKRKGERIVVAQKKIKPNNNPFSTKSDYKKFLDYAKELRKQKVDVGYSSCVKGCSARYKAGKIKNLQSCVKTCSKNHNPFPGIPGKKPK